MKAMNRILTICLLGCAPAFAQVNPSATGPGRAPAGTSNLVYAFRYAQAAQLNTQMADMQTSNVSATLDYANRQQRYPFTMEYGGGYTWTLTGPGYLTGQFHRLLLTQGVDSRRSKLMLKDDVSYLPQAPTTGFSGIPGTGEIIGVPNPSPSTTQTILTINTHVVDNMASAQFDRTISYATTLGVTGAFDLLRYPDNNGLNINTANAGARLVRRLSGRTTLAGRGSFTQYSYPDASLSINTITEDLGIQHKWTRNLTTDITGGPQELGSNKSAIVPSSLRYSVDASVNYKLHYTAFNAAYTHGTNGGSGYMLGGTADVASVNFTHQFNPSTLLGLTAGYNRTASLNSINGVTNAEFGGAQVTWRLGNNLILFANYTAQNQTSTAALPGNTLDQMINTIAFGFGLSSRDQRPRR